MSKQLLVNNQLTVHEMFAGTDQVSCRIFWMKKRERLMKIKKSLWNIAMHIMYQIDMSIFYIII